MFLLDDILLAPFKGLAAVCQKIREAADEELDSQEKEILASLTELHQCLESGKIGDQEFDVRETVLLDRLDAARSARRPADEGD